jgi:putative endonuclease
MAVPSRARKNLGDSAERVAALYLEQHGCRILARNVRTRSGEIDLIAQDGEELAFVEVKARRGTRYGSPEEAITPRKQLKLLSLAEAFIAKQVEFAGRAWRIDIVAIELDARGKVIRLNHIKHAVLL